MIFRNVEETDGGKDEAAERQREMQRRREEARRNRQAVSIAHQVIHNNPKSVFQFLLLNSPGEKHHGAL